MPDNDKLIYLVFTAQHLLKKYLQNEFRKEKILITPSHTGILFSLLKNGPQTMNALSKMLFIKNSTVTGLIDRLENKKMVQRNSIGSDRRKWNISITDKGIEEVNKAQVIIKRINSEIKDGNQTSEIKGMQKVLKGFFQKFSE